PQAQYFKGVVALIRSFMCQRRDYIMRGLVLSIAVWIGERREREWCGVIWRIGGIGETVVSGVSTEYRIITRTLATFL
ncbi:hypothetical protein, partial [Hungatella hathewayi]|uniref:hypothetical protein n=1 Tax=Hungatella hathewayi TaxID=154046 RepID=UPI00356AF179